MISEKQIKNYFCSIMILRVVSETEQKFAEIKDDDGFECDDIELIESWIKEISDQLAEFRQI